VLVLVTDGQVANEDQILNHLGKRLDGIRVFTLGIDQAVNEAFLRRLAGLGNGLCEVVESEERLEEVMDKMHRCIGTPMLTGLRLEADGLQVETETLVPSRLPDLFAGAPVLLLGRYRGAAAGTVKLHGCDAAGNSVTLKVAGRSSDNRAVASVWARGRVRELEDNFVTGKGNPAELEKRILETSLRFGVLCRFTAFVAVDRVAVVNKGGKRHRVTQAVETPAGWKGKEGQMDTFATDFEVPALEDESGSQVVALDDADTGLQSSDFDLALGDAGQGQAGNAEIESVDSLLCEFSGADNSGFGVAPDSPNAPPPSPAPASAYVPPMRSTGHGAMPMSRPTAAPPPACAAMPPAAAKPAQRERIAAMPKLAKSGQAGPWRSAQPPSAGHRSIWGLLLFLVTALLIGVPLLGWLFGWW
jgi:Ca-activated chloride channel family protein